jgi:hypothetical protein
MVVGVICEYRNAEDPEAYAMSVVERAHNGVQVRDALAAARDAHTSP